MKEARLPGTPWRADGKREKAGEWPPQSFASISPLAAPVQNFRSHGADLGHGGFEVQGFCHKSWDLGRRMFYGPKSEEESDSGLLGQTSEVLFRHGDTQASSSQRRLATFSGTPSWPSESTGLLSSLEVLP